MIKSIEIENIKGIQQKRFNLNIIPNKPSLLVAPNGFGKSSIASAFNSMNSRRIVLSDDNLYAENSTNLPKVSIEYLKEDRSTVNLHATSDSNTISQEFDCFVINNLTKPKGIGSRHGRATATLIIQNVVLVDSIPTNVSFGYSYTKSKNRFGTNKRILPNANIVLDNMQLVEKISSNYKALERANGQRIKASIQNVIDEINSQNGTKEQLVNWLEHNKVNDLKQIDHLDTIGKIISEFDIGLESETESYLVAIQLIWLFDEDKDIFKKACKFNNYKLDKKRFDITLEAFNCTWKNIRSTESRGKLLVKFPKAIHISNGQRDILTFISMLFKAKQNLKKGENILIIDEVFDYLDDANLTAAQYYITQFIKEFKDSGRKIYPLILTHLNPNYFKNFAFSNQKIYYLNKSEININHGMKALLRNRNDEQIKDDVSKFLLHYHPDNISKRNEFRVLGIPELWGEGGNFFQYLNGEIVNYLNDQPYDPFAVCGALRIKIEKLAYEKLQSVDSKTEFLQTWKTRSKLDKAEEKGIISPESHYLLGVIYNEGMHWRENQDNVSPIAAKLENLTIKKLINDIFAQ